MRRALLCLACLALRGQEFHAAAGRLHGVGTQDKTYSWMIGYAQRITLRTALSFGWFNEGHLPGHHRDGGALMAWRLVPLGGEASPRLCFGAGLYRTFDTEDLGPTYANRHALKGIFGASLQMPFRGSPWGAHLQITRTVMSSNQDTRTLLAGLAYSFRRAEATLASSRNQPPSDRQALTLFYGKAILNSQTSQSDEAFALEYRRRWSESSDWTLTYSDEGDLELIRRDTLAFQGWMVTPRLGGRLQLGLGLGPTLCHADTPEGAPEPARPWGWGGRVSMGARWRKEGSPWQMRLMWHRTRTPNNRDTDLILTGLGLAF